MADSSTGGFLTPAATPAPIEGDALVNFIQEWIVGVTGISASLCRPRWQPEPPNIPKDGTTWLAFGITETESDTYAVELHDPTANGGKGSSQLRRHEVLEISATFYGP